MALDVEFKSHPVTVVALIKTALQQLDKKNDFFPVMGKEWVDTREQVEKDLDDAFRQWARR